MMYSITYNMGQGRPLTIQRRFNQFKKLSQMLAQSYPNHFLPHLPTDDDEYRQDRLEVYLLKLLSNPYLFASARPAPLPEPLSAFLNPTGFTTVNGIERLSNQAFRVANMASSVFNKFNLFGRAEKSSQGGDTSERLNKLIARCRSSVLGALSTIPGVTLENVSLASGIEGEEGMRYGHSYRPCELSGKDKNRWGLYAVLGVVDKAYFLAGHMMEKCVLVPANVVVK